MIIRTHCLFIYWYILVLYWVNKLQKLFYFEPSYNIKDVYIDNEYNYYKKTYHVHIWEVAHIFENGWHMQE